MNFTDVERDVHKLIGLELNSISRSAAITIENIDDEQERLKSYVQRTAIPVAGQWMS